jgi:hypothetical protein
MQMNVFSKLGMTSSDFVQPMDGPAGRTTA